MMENVTVLPVGWKISRLGEVCQTVETVKRKATKPQREFIYIDIGSVDNSTNRVVGHKTFKWKDAPSRAQQIIYKNDVLFSTVRTYLKNIAFIGAEVYDGAIASSGFCVLRAKPDQVLPDYLFQFSLSHNFLKELHSLQTGSSYPAVRDKDVFAQSIPLPPLSTQHAIVEKIEELFSELDKGVESLRTALAQLKTYRQCVLKWAFEGRLTHEDVVDGELPKGWRMAKVGEICKVVRGGSPRPAGDSRYYNGKIPFLKVADLTGDDGVYLRTFSYTIKEAGLKKTRQISPNTLLLSNSGATLGVPKICTIKATMNDGIAAFLDLDQRSNLFLYYYWKSKTQYLRNINMGAAQPNLNTDIIRSCDLPLPSIEEQQIVVGAIESRLSMADKVEESIRLSFGQAEALRQSILKKAFEGGLV